MMFHVGNNTFSPDIRALFIRGRRAVHFVWGP
ncbi:unnamed protein product [Acanthoscelides obtectus]|uniref:Uncharacterized protein n=1 Tax=Acanthoscelides obtectus TaxID=200917 RepID=A0A9P0PQB6_ACAOB|nr:unnamed protein product [Acanthoscelides obtectus]CAK1640548.1 hypothetical protein AOBTE_LOCUS11792 [Acanthoscelides obtectus]